MHTDGIVHVECGWHDASGAVHVERSRDQITKTFFVRIDEVIGYIYISVTHVLICVLIFFNRPLRSS